MHYNCTLCALRFRARSDLWRLNARPSSDVSASSLRQLEDISFRLATLVEQSQSTSTDIAKGIAEVRLTQEGKAST